MVKEDLTKDEILKCKQVIFGLLQLEAKHENLPVPSVGGGRGGKSSIRREEQYRLLWNELEIFLKSHASRSANHNEVLSCLLEIRNKDDKDKVELDQALRELDGYLSFLQHFFSKSPKRKSILQLKQTKTSRFQTRQRRYERSRECD